MRLLVVSASCYQRVAAHADTALGRGGCIIALEGHTGASQSWLAGFLSERASLIERFAMTAVDDLSVIPWKEWYLSKGMEKDTARRLRLSGDGPRIVYLTKMKYGVTVRDDRAWIESRIRERPEQKSAATSKKPRRG
jgi:hypothetical protein